MSHERLLGHWSLYVATMLVVDDMDRSISFYRDQLGFGVREQQPHIALLELGHTLLYLITESPPTPDKPALTLSNLNTPTQSSVVLVFRVADCHAAYEDLRARGVVFLTPPTVPPWGGWRCFARDPNGYVIEIEQPAA
jgi:catechol 2,3-dioxygenase-like lactoylglutathione lyase family enzyme